MLWNKGPFIFRLCDFRHLIPHSATLSLSTICSPELFGTVLWLIKHTFTSSLFKSA